MGAKNSRIIVIDEREDSRVPFLRGILTRSIQDAGLSFDDAYAIASDVRDDIEKRDEIRSSELRTLVAERMRTAGFAELADRYLTPRVERASVVVRSRSGEGNPFSKGLLSQSLEICALARDDMFTVAAEVENHLAQTGTHTVSTTDVGMATARILRRRFGDEMAGRYVRWTAFRRSGVPLILLMGGTTGCGKSTISAMMAHRLGIVRTQSTDMLREVMRLLVPVKLMPSLHESSFGAYRVLPRWRGMDDVAIEPHMLDGYLMQAEEVAVAIEGVFRRAIREQVSLILEGVHVNPALQRRLIKRDEAIVVPVLLAALKKKRLRRQLIGRGQQVARRRSERYLDHMDEIWQLQSFLLSEADRHEVVIIHNTSPEDAVRQIMQTVSEALAGRFSEDEKEVFVG